MKFSITDFIDKFAYHIEGIDHSVLQVVNEYLNLYGKGHTFEELIALPYIFDYKKVSHTNQPDQEVYEWSIWAAIGQYICDNNLIRNFTIYADAKQIDETYRFHLIDVYWDCPTEQHYIKRSSDKFSLEYLADSVELKLSVWVENRWDTFDTYPTKKEIAVQLLKLSDRFNDITFN